MGSNDHLDQPGWDLDEPPKLAIRVFPTRLSKADIEQIRESFDTVHRGPPRYIVTGFPEGPEFNVQHPTKKTDEVNHCPQGEERS